MQTHVHAMTNVTGVVRGGMPNRDDDSLRQAFLTALLLTGSACMAEAAVLKAILSDGSKSGDSQPLLCRTVNASLGMPGPMRLMSLAELESTRNAVPCALRSVLSLKLLPRQCFVLRVLLSLPKRECALLLNISEAEVGHYCGAAAATLSSVEWRLHQI